MPSIIIYQMFSLGMEHKQRCSPIAHAGPHLAWQWQAGKPAGAVAHSKNMGMRHGLALRPSMKEQLGHDIQTCWLRASRWFCVVAEIVCERWSVGSRACPIFSFQKPFSYGLGEPSKTPFSWRRGMQLEVKCSGESPNCPKLLQAPPLPLFPKVVLLSIDNLIESTRKNKLVEWANTGCPPTKLEH